MIFDFWLCVTVDIILGLCLYVNSVGSLLFNCVGISTGICQREWIKNLYYGSTSLTLTTNADMTFSITHMHIFFSFPNLVTCSCRINPPSSHVHHLISPTSNATHKIVNNCSLLYSLLPLTGWLSCAFSSSALFIPRKRVTSVLVLVDYRLLAACCLLPTATCQLRTAK